LKVKGFDVEGLDVEGRSPAEVASIMAEVERAIEAVRQLGPGASSADIMAAYERLRPSSDDGGELIYEIDEDSAAS
jgi:hypothetical protein